jgi:Ca-activated chloride channel homolog
MEPLLEWLREQGVEFRVPELLWAVLLTPVLLLFYGAARRARRHVAGTFRVGGQAGLKGSTSAQRGRLGPTVRRSRPWATAGRTLAILLLLLGLAGLVVGFARPVVPLDTPNDRATVVVVVEASLTMRATDVSPTRFEAARATARSIAAALPARVQVAVVGYSQSAYILLPPTRDHGAAPPALSRLRTAAEAAVGDAIAVAIATVPLLEGNEQLSGPSGPAAPPAPGASAASGGGAPSTRAPAAIILIASGENTTGRPLGESLRTAAEAGIPVHTVPIGPRPGAEQRAPFEAGTLRQIAQATGGRFLTAPTRSTWQELFRPLGSAVTVEVQPQEVGHYVGAAALGVIALAMLLSLLATRRLV